jgi:hypothetical protein
MIRNMAIPDSGLDAIGVEFASHLERGGTAGSFLIDHPNLNAAQVNKLLWRITEYPQLIAEIEWLRSKVSPCVVGESLVATWVRGKHTDEGSESDIVARNDIRIEVKYAILNAQGKTKRWSWMKIYGEQGRKKYDRLVLIGDRDERYSSLYSDEGSRWVIFDVPFCDVRPLTIDGGKWKLIQLTTNPETASSRASKLFSRYIVSESEIERRYRE